MKAFSTDRGTPYRGSEGGFTLPEVLVTILIMGILAGIAIPSWLNIQDARRVDSATNQVAADLRQAHTSATNRLTSYSLVVPAANSSTYQIQPSGGTAITKTLPRNTRITSATTVRFNPNGSAEVITGAASPITVGSSSNSHTIEFNTQTSRIKVVL